MPLHLSGLVAIITTPTAPRTTPAASGATVAFTASPRTLAERLQFLVADAKRILARPEAFTLAEIRWAHDMLSAPAMPQPQTGHVPFCRLRRKHAR
jgi:hypothetical protein